MKHFLFLAKTFVVLLLLFLFFPKNAYAYVDPGTGSYIIQILLAAVFGFAFALKLYWRKLKSLFYGLFLKKDDVEEKKGK